MTNHLLQFIGCFIFPILIKPDVFYSIKFRSRSILNYGSLAVLIFGATGLATASLAYVSYPMKIVFKSTKLIPTMMVSYLFSGNVYSVIDYLSALLLCCGTALFVYHPSETSTETSLVGIILLICSVSCDAFVPNLQQAIMHQASAEEVMTNSNLIGLIGVISYMLINGDLTDVVAVLFAQDSVKLIIGLAGIGISLAVSVFCYTCLVKEAGPVVAVGVSTLRKVASIVCTYIVFPKPLSVLEVWALATIIFGVCLEALKTKRKSSSHIAVTAAEK